MLILLPYLVFALLALISWNRWIEPYVDSGRELMVPWRLARGEALYRDVRFYYGPLAPYLAAETEAVGGRSLPARIAVAAAVALLSIEGLRRIARRCLAPERAAVATALAVAVCFFLRPGGCHLFPYSLDTAVAVASATWVLALGSGAGGKRAWPIGLCLAVALLSRPEIGLAMAVWLVLAALLDPSERSRRFPLLVSPAVSVMTSAAVYAVVSRGTPIETLREEGWLAFLAVPREFRNVYLSFSGLDRPGLRISELALAAIVLLLLGSWLSILAFAAGGARRHGSVSSTASTAAAVASLVALAAARLYAPPTLAASLSLLPPLVRPLPLFVLAGALWRAGTRVFGKVDRGVFERVPDIVLFLSALFSARLLLAAGYVGPYNGFYLPLPLLTGSIGLYGLADRISSRSELSAFARLVTAALCVWIAFRVVALAGVYRGAGWARVQTSAGSLWVPEPVAGATQASLADLARRTPADGSIVGFPEVGFLQYALGRRNPLPQDQFYPGHLGRLAEADAIVRLRESPPDAFVYVNVLTIGHGPVAFGADYLQDLDAAVRDISSPVAAFGPGARPGERIGDPDFFIEIREPRR